VAAPTVLSTVREVLQVELQIAQVEAELGKAMASLERAVSCQINDHPLRQAPGESGPALNLFETTETGHIDMPAADEAGENKLGGW
jgi:hypothetical protein